MKCAPRAGRVARMARWLAGGVAAAGGIGILAAGADAGARAATGEGFGMRLRPAPREVAAISPPAVIREAPTNETCLVARRDGTLELYAIGKPTSDTATVMRSTDGGLTWTEPVTAFRLHTRAYYAIQVLEARDGTLHAVVHDFREGPGGYRGRLWEVHYTRRTPGGEWVKPRLIVPGYIGSIRGFVQLESGRLVLAVARAMPDRMEAPKTGPDLGWHNTFVYCSDDAGATWRQSADELTLVLNGPNATRYGAIEPALLELKDGRLWMLVRDRGGRLWQSFSRDGGSRWPPLERSPFISSDSPAALLRLRDGKILLLTNACQNWTNPRSYAMGGREVLHAAISADEGRTWRGFREVLHEPVAETRGDRGTAYASAVQNEAGKVVVVSGQGEGKRAILALDPRWLEQAQVVADTSGGPVQWTAYGGQGLVSVGGKGDAAAGGVMIVGGKDAPSGASWNFPIAAAGELSFELSATAEVEGLTLGLNDHFTRVDDRKAAEYAVFAVALPPAGPDQRVRLRWSGATGSGTVVVDIDGKETARVSARRPAQWGVNYLRVDFRAGAAESGVAIRGLAMKIAP
jgi:hypothetical protein